MKNLTGVRHTHTTPCAVFGLFVSLLSFNTVMANEPTSSQLFYFNAYKDVYGNSWNMVWNNSNSTPLAFYGGHFTPQIGSSALSSNSLKIPSSYDVSSYTGLLNLAGCTPLPSPQLPSLPTPQASSKLVLTSFSPTNSYISPNNQTAINSIDFMIVADVRPVAGLEPSQTQPAPNNHKEFYLRWTITIENQNGNSSVLTGDTPIIPSNNVHQGADITIPVTADVPWEGKDQNGNILPDGEYTYQLDAQFIRIADLGNGNTQTKLIDESATGKGTLIVDTAPPVISIITPPDGVVLNTSTIGFSVNYSDCGSGIDSTSFDALLNQNDQTAQFTINRNNASWSATLNNNVYTFVATIKDNAGNSTMTTTHFTVLAGNAIQQYTNTMAFLKSLQPLYGFKSDLSDLMLASYFTSATQAMYVTTPNGNQQYVAATQPKYMRFQQMYDGTIRVYGATLNVALDTNNDPTDVFGNYYNDIPANLDITPSVDFQTIMNAVLNGLGVTGLSVSPTSGERIIYKDASGVYHVAIVLSLVTSDNTPWMYIVDLHNASILYKYKTQSADYVTGQGNVFVDTNGGTSPCGGSLYDGCREPLDWLLVGGKQDCPCTFLNCFSFKKALTGRYADIIDNDLGACCGLMCTLISNKEVEYNGANLYIYHTGGGYIESHHFDEVNAYFNITRAAEYYLNHYGFELSHQDGHPLIPITINDAGLIPLGDAGLTTDYWENDCGNYQWFCDTFGYTKSINYHISFAPGDANTFATAFHEYNHAVVYDSASGEYNGDAAYKEGLAQFYADFMTLDNGYLVHDSTYNDTWLNHYLYPYDYEYLYCSMPDTLPPCSGLQPEPHYDGILLDQPLLRLRQWEINISNQPQIIYDDTFNAIFRIGNSFSFSKLLTAMLAAEDNKANVLGFDHEYYNILASFAWEGIHIPTYTVDNQYTNANSIVVGGICNNTANGNCASVQPEIVINDKQSANFSNEHIYFDTFTGNANLSVLLVSANSSELNNQNVWNAAIATVNANALTCIFCQLIGLPNCPCPPATSGYVNGYPGVYFVYTLYTPQDDLPAGTDGGRIAQQRDYAKGIYNNLHRTISIRLGDMSNLAVSQNPLSFPKLYYRLMTMDQNGKWVSSATRGEQSILIYSPQPANGGCTIARDGGYSELFEFLFIGLLIIIFIKVMRYAKGY